MKVVVTHLKAPWPAGVVVGSVVELAGCDVVVPAWAAGKCEPAPADAVAAHTWTKPEPQPEPAAPVSDAEELAIARALLAEAQREADELRASVVSLTDSRTKLADQLADTARQLTEAQAALAKAEEALAAKAKAKG